jgi:hypothetical protein
MRSSLTNTDVQYNSTYNCGDGADGGMDLALFGTLPVLRVAVTCSVGTRLIVTARPATEAWAWDRRAWVQRTVSLGMGTSRGETTALAS